MKNLTKSPASADNGRDKLAVIERLIQSWKKTALLHDHKATKVKTARNKTPLMSSQGGLPFGKRGQTRPYFDGQAGLPLLVLYRKDLPVTPDFMKKYEYVVLTIDENNGGYPSRSVAEKTLSVCCYESVEELVPLEDEDDDSGDHDEAFRYLPLKFTLVDDYPAFQTIIDLLKTMNLYDETMRGEFIKFRDQYKCHQGLKIGGYPYLLNPVAFLMTLDPDMAIQLDSTPLESSHLGYVAKNLKSIHYEFT